MPAMNADDPTRCPNIWIPRHVRPEREASILAKGPRRAHAERLSWLPRCYAKSVVRACGDVHSPTWGNMSKLREIRAATSRGLYRRRVSRKLSRLCRLDDDVATSNALGYPAWRLIVFRSRECLCLLPFPLVFFYLLSFLFSS